MMVVIAFFPIESGDIVLSDDVVIAQFLGLGARFLLQAIGLLAAAVHLEDSQCARRGNGLKVSRHISATSAE